MSCPTNANNSYPIQLLKRDGSPLFNNLDVAFDTLQSGAFPIEFIWGPRANPPIFSNTGKALLDDSLMDIPPTIRHSGKTYRLKQAQITRPYNKSFLADATANRADLTLLFKTDPLTPNEPTGHKYVLVSIPLLQTDAYANDPTYMLGLLGATSNGPFSLEQCLPPVGHRDYIGYTTCLDGTPTLNAFVMVFFKGCHISRTSFDAMAAQLGSTGDEWAFPLSSPGDFNIGLPTFFDEAAFSKSILSSLSFVGNVEGFQTAPTPATGTPRPTNLSQYKCVPLDIDKNVSDGTVQFDANGNLMTLNDILANRNTIVVNTTAAVPLTPVQIEGLAAGGILVLLLLLIFLFIRYGGLAGYEVVAIRGYFPYFVTGTLFCFLGFMLGSGITRG